jgi:predicted helicase
MTEITAEELAKVNSFPRLVGLLRDKLEWPINEDYDYDDVVFDYEPHELGLKAEETAKLREIHQLRPLVTGQPWGIFFLSFDDKAMSVTVLRRILRALVVKQRASGQSADRAAWLKEDLIFAANFGKSGERELAFVHFSDGASTGDLPIMKVLGWNAKDTTLHNRHAADLLAKRLAWPDEPSDQKAWRNQWASAFEVSYREVITTSKDLAVRLASLASDIRARANQLLEAETASGPMRIMLEAFRKNLIHDLNDDGFADMFAQTICYGMLAARISRPVGIIADNLADMVPKTNPFLKELFGNFLNIGGRDKRSGLDFDELGVRDVVDMLNSANMEAVLRDFGDRNPKEDPVIHFYELFLKEYDPEKRMQRGVFYTPRPVVNFIVRGVDEILRTEFGLPLGLADTSTWAELAARNDKITIPAHVNPAAPFVQILDPATGTGTFLVEVVDLIHKRMVETWKAEGKSLAVIKAAWNAYVPKHLLPRLTAFELMMAPYAIAHMKIGLKLVETGYTFGSDERAHVFLTNALEPAHDLDPTFNFMSMALAHEATAANAAKDTAVFTIVIGNPPYSSRSTSNSKWIMDLIECYKKNVRNVETQIQALSDDYVKFFRLAQWNIQKSGAGVFGLITNNGYLDGHIFSDMRINLCNSSSCINLFNLHGDSRKRETSPDGKSDQNVFDIQQGVGIAIAHHLGSMGDCKICYLDIWGNREEKFETLLDLSTIDCGVVKATPARSFIPRMVDHAEWDAWPSIAQCFGTGDWVSDKTIHYGSGFKSQQDQFAIGFSKNDVAENIETLLQQGMTETRMRAMYQLCSSNQWNFKKAVQSLSKTNWRSQIVDVLFRPFDNRFTVIDPNVVTNPRTELMNQFSRPNIAILATRKSTEGFSVFVTDKPCGHKIVGNYDMTTVFPIYFYDDTLSQFSVEYSEKRSNFSKGYEREISSLVGVSATHQPVSPIDLASYIYAILHAPQYRRRYAEFLKSDFPRIPTPGSRALFADLVPLGRELVALHLLKPDEASVLQAPEIRFAGNGGAQVEKGYPEYENGKVMINASRWFEDVPKATWEFQVGGYQPCERWLKDRAAKGGKNPSPGRILTDEDILHYRRMVVALTETRRIMAEIDKVIDQQGGWPGAFTVKELVDA